MYQCSNMGIVKSLARISAGGYWINERILTQLTSTEGSPIYRLFKNKKAGCYYKETLLRCLFSPTLENLPDEVWKEIDGSQGYYISNKGRVKKIKIIDNNPDFWYELQINPWIMNTGYYMVNIPYYIDGKKKTKYKLVHVLVAEAFIENPDPSTKTAVDHKDTNKLNNEVTNLRWVTNSENMMNPLTRKHNSDAHPKEVLKRRKAVAVYKDGTLLGTYSWVKELSEKSVNDFGEYFSQGSIRSALKSGKKYKNLYTLKYV